MKRRRTAPSAAWIHNSYLGMACMIEKQAGIIAAGPTCTPEAQALATAIEQQAYRLRTLLKERVDK